MLVYVIFISSKQIHINLQFAPKNRDLIFISRVKNPLLVILKILLRLHLRCQPNLQLPILSRAEFLRNIYPYLLNWPSGLIDEYQPEFFLIFPRIILNKIIALVELLRIENINKLAPIFDPDRAAFFWLRIISGLVIRIEDTSELQIKIFTISSFSPRVKPLSGSSTSSVTNLMDLI